MLKKKIENDLKQAVKSLGYEVIDIVCSIPKNPAFGDYTTNVALQLAKQKSSKVKQSPPEVAREILEKLKSFDFAQDDFDKIEIAGGGFINFFIKDSVLIENLGQHLDIKTDTPKKYLIEYGHVNPLKEIHIGHLRTFILGESISRILESLGHEVFRANYQGDIGLHIAKAIWGIEKIGLPAKELNLKEKAEFLGKAYAEGVKSYEEDPTFKEEIDKINVGLYQKREDLQEVYQLARSWSLAYFEPIYKLLGVKYDRCFFESEVFKRGTQIVLENIGKVFESSNGAIIFPGEKYDLHTRVFINSVGNPTYEGKDMGLAELEYDTFNYDNSIHVVASEQEGYFQVIIKAVDLLFPYLKGKKHHLSYGLVDLKEGKMSSRTGNVVTIDDLVAVVAGKIREVAKTADPKVVMGAIKYSYLKYSPQPNMVFDIEKSVSLQRDSGPYIQYTYARIQSVLRKAQPETTPKESGPTFGVNVQERQLLAKLLYYHEIAAEAAQQYHPNLIASYLADLAHVYNLFYQENKIIGADNESLRLEISRAVANVLSKGLNLLGIDSPERM